MHRWSSLNQRQLALLTRIAAGSDPVTSDNADLALTARTLKERGLIVMPKAEGKKWRAEITKAGRFYLEHGHHPDRPARPPRTTQTVTRKTSASARAKQAPAADSVPKQATRPERSPTGATVPRAVKSPALPARSATPEIAGPALIEQVLEAGRFLRISDPDAKERARYRRAFDAARTCAPPGYRLTYSGRAQGDFFLALLRTTGQDDTEWNRIRLQRSRTISDIDEVLAAVQGDHSAFEISDDVLPRVLSLLRLLAEQALRRHGDMAVSKKRKQPRPLLTVHGRTFEVSFRERQKHVPYVPQPKGQRRTYDWQQVTPAHRFEPSGELELHLTQQQYYGWKKDWGDTPKKPLEDQINTIFRALKTHVEEQEKARLEREAEQKRLQAEWEQQKAERQRAEAEERARRQRQWQAALTRAKTEAAEAKMAETFAASLDAWRTAGEIRAFCTALETAAAHAADPAERERLHQWSLWGQAQADHLDPTSDGSSLRTTPYETEPTSDELRPFLNGWSPHRPEKEEPPAPPPPARPEPEPRHDVSAALADQGWRYGPRGRAQWWRR